MLCGYEGSDKFISLNASAFDPEVVFSTNLVALHSVSG